MILALKGGCDGVVQFVMIAALMGVFAAIIIFLYFSFAMGKGKFVGRERMSQNLFRRVGNWEISRVR